MNKQVELAEKIIKKLLSGKNSKPGKKINLKEHDIINLIHISKEKIK